MRNIQKCVYIYTCVLTVEIAESIIKLVVMLPIVRFSWLAALQNTQEKTVLWTIKIKLLIDVVALDMLQNATLIDARYYKNNTIA